MKNKILLGDCLDKLKELEDNSVDSIVTDPPYHLTSIVKRFGKKDSAPAQYGSDGVFQRASKGFMGKEWDGGDIAFRTEVWEECLRVLKPGGHILAFGGTRTYHRMTVAIEDSGFEIRDCIFWCYGSGFPKSHNIGKAVDKLQGKEVENKSSFSGVSETRDNTKNIMRYKKCNECGKLLFSPDPCKCEWRTKKADNKWNGWGTALKPAVEPIVVARKPLSEKSVAENVLKWGTGGINIDGCRVGTDLIQSVGTLGKRKFQIGKNNPVKVIGKHQGRFPANLIHSGDDEVVELFPESNSGKGKANTYEKEGGQWGKGKQIRNADFGDSGSAARFFYCAKSSKSERNKGLEGFEEKQTTGGGGLTAEIKEDGSYETASAGGKYGSIKAKQKNNHPTVKPIKLMQYLVRLVTPRGGTVLDPFMGSGTTGIACKLEGFDFIGIEREEEYIKIAEARINAWQKENKLL